MRVPLCVVLVLCLCACILCSVSARKPDADSKIDAEAHKRINERVASPLFHNSDARELWADYKRTYGKSYDAATDAQRFAIFQKNVEDVKKCNAEKRSYTCKAS